MLQFIAMIVLVGAILWICPAWYPTGIAKEPQPLAILFAICLYLLLCGVQTASWWPWRKPTTP